MPTILSVNATHPETRPIEEAARVLCAGGLVAFPTETVYGLAADAQNPAAIDRLNRVKGRPPHKPYSIHLYAIEQLDDFVEEVPEAARYLMDRFWPGPLTIILPAKDGRTVGFRFPNHPVALAFLRSCARAVVAPSANRSGEVPPTDGCAVSVGLIDQIDCLLDAGPTPVGQESTVVQVRGHRVDVLRAGAISRHALLTDEVVRGSVPSI